MGRERVRRVDIPADVAQKLRMPNKNLTEQQVQEAIFRGYETSSFNPNTQYGPRLYVMGTSTDNVRLQAALRPVDRQQGHWECRTAVRRPKGIGWR
jgi:hypothetical protein